MFDLITGGWTTYAIIAGVMAIAGGGGLYVYHFKPLNAKDKIIQTQQQTINSLNFDINNLKIKVKNTDNLLVKCKDKKIIDTFEQDINTQADSLNNLYKDYLKYKGDVNENESNEKNVSKTNIKPTIRFIF